MAEDDGGWQEPKPRRGRGARKSTKELLGGGTKKRGSFGGGPARSREEVLDEFGRACARWRKAWDELPCREALRPALRRVRAELGSKGVRSGDAGPADGEGLQDQGDPVLDGVSEDEARESAVDSTQAELHKEGARGDASKGARWPRRPSGLSCAVCLGLGSFEDEGWEIVRRTWIQYFAFLAIVEALGKFIPVPSPEPLHAPEVSFPKTESAKD